MSYDNEKPNVEVMIGTMVKLEDGLKSEECENESKSSANSSRYSDHQI